MRAAVFNQHGSPEVIEIADVPRPELPAGHVLITVRAAALNHLDLWARRGL
ncbi:MAG: alcohol dehydrogenase, partial [Gemmatimonadetes bacterium]|nr:alcohol dehydrogenase [Gemmatimonadota bacterium]